jgi:hypothetical protein
MVMLSIRSYYIFQLYYTGYHERKCLLHLKSQKTCPYQLLPQPIRDPVKPVQN